jgi:hypothetical protein
MRTHRVEQKLARILLEVGEPAPPAKVLAATAGGDKRRLRGLPAIARAVVTRSRIRSGSRSAGDQVSKAD